MKQPPTSSSILSQNAITFFGFFVLFFFVCIVIVQYLGQQMLAEKFAVLLYFTLCIATCTIFIQIWTQQRWERWLSIYSFCYNACATQVHRIWSWITTISWLCTLVSSVFYFFHRFRLLLALTTWLLVYFINYTRYDSIMIASWAGFLLPATIVVDSTIIGVISAFITCIAVYIVFGTYNSSLDSTMKNV